MNAWRCCLLLLFIIISLSSNSQSLKLTGRVINERNEPLSGVSIKITDGGGSTTDVEGRFSLSLITNKKYEITFSAVGYSTKIISDVEVLNNKANDLNIVLEVRATSGENVVVSAKTTARRETAASLISFQKNTNTVASVISAETIRRSPDKNTGEVLKRIPGTSVQDGKYLIVRGLSDRYNSAMLNGIQLSSTEPDRKTFSFDIFPSSMIDNIVINKAFVPEYPGEWAGGLVQVNTKDIPSRNFFTIQVGTGFNSRTIGNNFYSYEGGKTDFLGFDDGSRALPGSMPRKSQFQALSDAQKTEIGKQIAAGKWSVQEKGIPLNTSFQASGGFNTRLFGKDFGVIVGLTYSRSLRNLEFNNRFFSFDNNMASLLFDYDNNKYSTDVLGGLLANFSLKINNNNRITVKNLLNITSSDFTTLRTGTDYEQDPQEGDRIRARELSFKSNTFYNSQIQGEHNITSLKSKFTWYGSFNILDAYIPLQRRVQYNQSDPGGPYSLLIGEARSQKTGSVFYSMLSDYIYNAGGDITTSFMLSGKKQTVKGGYLFQVKDRLFDSRPFSIYLTDGTSPVRLLNEDEVFQPENFDASDPRKFKFDEIIGKQFRYMANSILNAAYLQLDNQFGDFRFIWGARYEHFDQLVGSANTSDERHSYAKKGDLLPAMNAVYRLNNLTNIRLSGSQTIIRPEFRELTNFAFYDFELGAAVIGSSSLKRTKVTNIDLRYELYPRAGEVMSVGVFFKNFRNPIELYFNQSGVATNTFNFLNVDKATSYGVEFELRKKLDFLDVLKNVTFQTNVSYIYNKVKDDQVKIDRPMQGQSPYLVNASLQYDVESLGLNTTLLFNQIGRRILYVGNDVIPEIWEAPRPLFDFQVAKKLFANKGEIRLNVSDVLNKRAYYYHDLDNNKKFKTSSLDAVAINRNYGTNFSLTLGYSF